MNAARLLEYFDRIAEAPDAVSRLRKFILDLAVRGKLVEQDPNDEPASELLKKIQNQRAKLEKDGKLAKIKQCQPIDEEELPSGYSDCESFARLICVAYPCKGLTGIQSAKPGNFPLVVTAESRLACDHYDFDGSATLVPLVSSTGHGHASINRLHYQEGKFAVGSILCAIFPVEEKLLSARFIYEYLSAYKEELLVSKMIGTANVTLTMSKIAEIPIPITTPRSQARLHELMALCDRLEASQAKRESRRDRLASASLKRIGQHEDVDNGEEFREKVRFHLHHLPRLVTRSEHVKELRQTILNLAVRGMLVPQDPNDEPASELLKKVHAKKNKLLKDGLIRKTRAVLLDEEGESCIPRTWRWICIDQFFIVTGGIQKTPAREPQNNHYPCISVGNVYRNRFELDCVKRFELRDGELEKYAVEPFDIMVVEGNGSSSEIGRCAMWEGQLDNCVHQNHLIRCRPIDKEVAKYVAVYLNSSFGVAGMTSRAITSTGLYNLSVDKIKRVSVSIPPLAEQHRIVAKVDELMTLCDQLEVHLATNQTNQSRLLEATLCDALGVTCLPVSRPSRPAPSPTRVAATHTEQPPRPITPRPGPVETPTAAVQGSLIEQPTPQVGKPRAANGDVPGAILAHMKPGQEYSRAQLAEALGLSVYEWNMAIRELKESGRVVQTGERRGARYRIKLNS